MIQTGLQVTTPTDTTIVLTRTFRAPRRLVWEAMTDPAKMRRWLLGPPGWSMTHCELEPRVGGALNLGWKQDDEQATITIRGEFTEFAPYDRMAHTETMEMNGATIGSLLETHEFTEQGGVTSMRITQKYESREARDGALASGMDQGMEAGYQRLDAIFAESLPPAGATSA